MKPLNKKGFSAIYVVLIIAIVGIIGFTGWYVWSKNQTPKVSSYQECVKAKGAKILETYPEQCVINGQTFVNPSQKAAASMTTQTNNPTVQLPATTHRYLTIKEWGVKIPVSSDIYDLIYSIDNALYLNSEKFIALTNGECNLKNKEYLGYVIRSAEGTKQFKDTIIAKADGVKKIGDYYYLYQEPTQMYCQQNPPNQDLANYFKKVVPIIKDAFNGIQEM